MCVHYRTGSDMEKLFPRAGALLLDLRVLEYGVLR